MKIKKIIAKNFREALALVKKELGSDAVILSSEEKKGARPHVEVTAAIDYDIDYGQKSDYSAFSAAGSQVRETEGLHELKNELNDIKKYLESMKNCGFELKLPEERKKMFYFLKEKSISEDFALQIIEKARDIKDLETVMSDDIMVKSVFDDAVPGQARLLAGGGIKIIMLIGPTGSGKTTTVAKLASKAIKERKRVGLISLDTYKVGAAEQIRIYSRMIGIPLDVVSSPANLVDSVRKFSDRDLLIIDTMGQHPGDEKYLRLIKGVHSTGLPVETQLLLSTSSDSDFLMEAYRHYRQLSIDSLGFTKTDEAVKLGSIYNLCRVYRKPVAYITTGQSVPGNIEFADSLKLTNLILRTGSA